MKQVIAAMCFMLAASPFAMAQDMPKDAGKKAAGTTEQSAKPPKAADKAKKEPTEKQKAQQDKMKACSTQAKDKNMKGDERKAFMKDCMKKT